jgi:hypothetical protein
MNQAPTAPLPQSSPFKGRRYISLFFPFKGEEIYRVNLLIKGEEIK